MLALHASAYAVALWLACYLLSRRPASRPLVATACGLLAYAGTLAADVLLSAFVAGPAPGPAADPPNWLSLARNLLTLGPAVCWCIALVPDGALDQWDRWRRTPGAMLLAPAGGAAVALGLILVLATPLVHARWVGWLHAVVSVGLLAALLVLAARARRTMTPPRTGALTLLSALFFGLGAGLLLLDLPWLPRWALMLAIGADLVVFGWVVAALDAFDAGERLRADLVRSLAGAAALAAFFGGQVAVALALGAGPPVAIHALLLGATGGAIALATLWDRLQVAFDRLALGAGSSFAARRAALLLAAAAVPRQPEQENLLALSEEEFVALTRRALSAYGDLPKLAASPLIRLPLVDARLASRGRTGDVLERASALKEVLGESVARLKPAGGAAFGATDEWRHYNALHFPYVLGLRPYSRRGTSAVTGRDGASEAAEAALRWFRGEVPERTLHNWQRAAARLVALDLRTRAAAAFTATTPVEAPSPPKLAAVGSSRQ